MSIFRSWNIFWWSSTQVLAKVCASRASWLSKVFKTQLQVFWLWPHKLWMQRHSLDEGWTKLPLLQNLSQGQVYLSKVGGLQVKASHVSQSKWGGGSEWAHRGIFLMKLWINWAPIITNVLICASLEHTLDIQKHQKHWPPALFMYTVNVRIPNIQFGKRNKIWFGIWTLGFWTFRRFGYFGSFGLRFSH